MKELKSYISEGFFSNVGADNKIKLAIDTIKNASINDEIDSSEKKRKFVDLLTSILKDIETVIKKGKLVFEYIRDDRTCVNRKITISLEITESNKVSWLYSSQSIKFGSIAYDTALRIAGDLYYETKYSYQYPKLRHNISKTIKITEFKMS